MDLDEIQAIWEKDFMMDFSHIDREINKVVFMQNKYFNIYKKEATVLKDLEIQFRELKREKSEFYVDGASKLPKSEKEWKQIPRRKIMKSESGLYLDADADLNELIMKKHVQNLKLQYLDIIFDNLKNRRYTLRTSFDIRKFESGS